MKKLLCAFLLCSVLTAKATTIITSPTVSGHWTLAGSPYMIYNDVTVDGSSLLIIDPGVDIMFAGSYMMNVTGNLYAAGTATQPITFHSSDTTGWSTPTTAGGWNGIHLQYYGGTGTDSSSVAYCQVYDCKSNALNITSRNIKVANCSFFHNSGYVLNCLESTINTFEMAGCSIHDNVSFNTCFAYGGTFHIHNCDFHDNIASTNMLSINKANMLLDSNDFYLNTQTDSQNTTTIDIEYCTGVAMGNKVHDNTSEFDGGISAYYSTLDIVGNYICNNLSLIDMISGTVCGSTQGGGGIRLSAEGDSTNYCNYTVRNNIIANNTAMYAGGAVYIMGANADIFNNQIVNNMATQGGAIHVFNNVTTSGHKRVRVKNNLFYGNLTTDPGLPNPQANMEIESGDTIEYTYNWTEHPFYLDNINISFGYNYLLGDTAKNIVGTSPGMVAPTTAKGVATDASAANFDLLSTSPCINAGDTAGTNTCAYDYAGNIRIYGGKIDIGAYESKVKNPLYVAPLPGAGISAYPNPASSVLLISVPSSAGSIALHDITGKEIIKKTVTGTLTAFDIHDIPRGIYYAVWNNGSNRKAVQQVVVE